jgi:hypothetical protein
MNIGVQNSGAYLMPLTADSDPAHTPITSGSALTSGLYTLEFMTQSLAGSVVTITSAVPEPGTWEMMLAGAMTTIAVLGRRTNRMARIADTPVQ